MMRHHTATRWRALTYVTGVTEQHRADYVATRRRACARVSRYDGCGCREQSCALYNRFPRSPYRIAIERRRQTGR